MASEEYEMVSVSTASPSSPSSPVPGSSVPVSPSDSDSESVVFEELEVSTDKTFNDDETFQAILSNYQGKKPLSQKWCFVIAGCCFLLWVFLIIAYANIKVRDIPSSLRWQTSVVMAGTNVTLSSYDPKNKNLTMNSLRDSQLSPLFEYITWLNIKQYPSSSSQSGFYMTRGNRGSYDIKSLSSKDTTVLIENTQFAFESNFFYIEQLILNPGLPCDDPSVYHLIKSDTTHQWRHSSFALYWLYKPLTQQFLPIQSEPVEPSLKPSKLSKLHFAEFSPDGTKVLFGLNHDLYIQDLSDLHVHRITETGSRDIFNGKPDWVYEEEMLSSDRAFWWAPDSQNLVYGSINDTGVFDYELDYYVSDANDIGLTYEFEKSESTVDGVNQYPIKKKLKYPKPGTKIPTIELFNYNVKEHKLSSLSLDDKSWNYILYDCGWVNNDNLLVKISDRTSSFQSKQIVTISTNQATEIAFVDAAVDFGGWFDKYSPIVPVKNGYIDKIIVNNRTHLAYYDEVLSKQPKMLTSSPDWDVLDSAAVVYDSNENLVYTLANIKGPMDSHLLAVDLEGDIKFVLGGEREGKYAFDTDSNGQHITLEYSGPGLPWQKILDTSKLHDSEDVEKYFKSTPMSSDYSSYKASVAKYNFPTKVYSTVKIGKADADMIEILPPNFDVKRKRKYPVLVNAYGGPGSQAFTKANYMGFEDIVSSQLDAIVLQIDPRGTDGRGWNQKGYGLKNIGNWEGRDIITLVSEYIKKNSKIVDQDNIAIWGWSYGGFTTLKTLELDQGKTFKFGMAVAPVTNFLFYNAFYTERYMKLPQDNPNYQKTSVISQTDSFKSLERFLIMHGTADDNVHFQNLLWLLDKFNVAGIENYDVHFFPDNDHAINYHNSGVIVYDKLLHWLQDAFMGKFKHFI